MAARKKTPKSTAFELGYSVYPTLKVNVSQRRILMVLVVLGYIGVFAGLYYFLLEKRSWVSFLLTFSPLWLMLIFFPQTESWIYTPWQKSPIQQEAHLYNDE